MADIWKVGQLHNGSILYRLAATQVFFAKFFLDHVTKPMVLRHSGGMGHFVFLRNIYIVVDISADKRDVQKTKQKQKKNLAKIEFSPKGHGPAHGPEIFRVDAAFVAAHFPSRVVWGPNPAELFC